MQFCIVGTGRCGTTLLQRMMNLHPAVFVFPETHWIPAMYKAYGLGAAPTEELLEIVRRTTHVTGLPVTDLDASRLREVAQVPERMTVRAFCDLVGGLLATDHGKTAWADKTPDYGEFMVMLQTLWPESRFIHATRDGPSVVASMSRHPGYRALASAGMTNWSDLPLDARPVEGQEAIPLTSFVDLWYERLANTRAESTRLRAGTYREVRFEELLADPGRCLAELASHARLSAPRSWLDAAAALVDPSRAKRRPPAAVTELFGEREWRLLDEVGYRSRAEGR
jgi:hypothetical protein